MSYDALVVGSGPNGLTAAITLARAGRRVLVLEAASRAGGAVATEELTLAGFRHDTFSAVHPAGAASPVFAAMDLERHGLRWVHPPVCLAHPLPDGGAVALYRDLERTVASLDAIHPGDGTSWRAFAAPFVDSFDALRDTMLGGFPPLRAPLRLTAGLGPRRMLGFVGLLGMPATSLGERLFAGEGSRAWLYGSALHSDVPPSGRGSAIAAAYLTLLGHGAGWPSPEGGAGRLADALLACLRELGGDVRTEARVVRVAVERRRVVGVELSSGERISAPLAIADTMPDALADLVGDAFPGRYARALRRYRYGPATLKVDWALDGPIPWLAPQAREAGTVHLGGSAPELLASTAAMRKGLPERPFMLLGQQSLADPTRAPAGKHTAWGYTHGPQTADWGVQSARHVERMEAQVERFAPGFRERILARHVLRPADLQARNANLVGGDVGGGSYSLRQVLFRPVPSLAPYRTPVRGLYIGSAATFPGGAVHGVPGHAAARLALARARIVG
ncbi:MAG TPA: NAD(P)/FAD-dependent oxidoreductase [Solirubrobacteraceae bacterium]|jgi:phytoene dehydrogenase-like protein